MEPNINQTPAPKAPVIPESEMKMPEDQFSDTTGTEPAPSHSINPLLIVALILMLTVLAVVVIWGEELVGMLLPEATVELESMPGDDGNTEAELNEMENELNQMDFSDMEENLDGIEAEMDAELESETEAGV